MRLEQLRSVVEIVRQGYSVSRAADALDTPQPALSRHLRSLERELGVDIFVRNPKRLKGLTQPGAAIFALAERVLADTQSISTVATDFSASRSGRLAIATTHTQARYALPPLVKRFTESYADVEIMIRQGSPEEIVEMVRAREADLCIGSQGGERAEDVVTFPCYAMERVVLVPEGHPLQKKQRLTLDALARYPIITYDEPFIGRSKLVRSFAARGLKPKIVLSSIDTDVIKAYVEVGLGIAVVAKLAYDAERDSRLRAVPAGHLFEPNVIRLSLRRNDYLRGYVYDFIEMFAPQLKRRRIEHALRQDRSEGEKAGTGEAPTGAPGRKKDVT